MFIPGGTGTPRRRRLDCMVRLEPFAGQSAEQGSFRPWYADCVGLHRRRRTDGVVSALLKFLEADWKLTEWAQSNAAEWVGLAMYIALAVYMTWHTMQAKKKNKQQRTPPEKHECYGTQRTISEIRLLRHTIVGGERDFPVDRQAESAARSSARRDADARHDRSLDGPIRLCHGYDSGFERAGTGRR